MRRFERELGKRSKATGGRRWFFVPEDQLTDAVGPLSREKPPNTGVVLVESAWRAGLRPYHRQKLALLWSNLRHFALEQAARGVAVRYVFTNSCYRDTLSPLVDELGPLTLMEPAERELRGDLAPLISSGGLRVVPHEGWLTSREQFAAGSGPRPPWRMDRFYRQVRRATGLLMSGRKPLGGKYSFDPENRLPWRGRPPAPDPPRFRPDPITREVGEEIEGGFARHPGTLDLTTVPATREDAEALWAWAKRSCLPRFGPYEDAMSTQSRGLFHTRISALLNLHRLLPSRVVREAAGMKIPLPCREGFVRQVLGWREFVRHVHEATDGFRRLPDGDPPVAAEGGDGGYGRWARRSWSVPRPTPFEDGGAAPSFLGSTEPLPPAYWGKPSGLACLDQVVADVWAEGYSHHITRLMVLSNLATLLDLSPREVTDWFWVAYTDAFDWVVEPNVLGMGTYAVGDLMTTKPYVSGAAYISRMSDYCGRCRFDPRTDCPITSLYWAFLARHASRLKDNQRLRLPLSALKRRSGARRRTDAKVFKTVQSALRSGRTVDPQNLGSAHK